MELNESNEQLRASIAEIRKLMQTALDSKQRDLLGGILTSIGSHPDTDTVGIAEQLDEQAVEFESEHPKLARAIREVMDSLNKMGV